MFDPKTNKFPYPIDTGDHYLEVTKDDGTVFDENYSYIDKTFSFKFKLFWVRVVLLFIVFPFQMIRMGFKVKGKKNLRKNKILIKSGVISVCNHVHMFDYIGLLNGLFPRKIKHLAWEKNISGKDGKIVKLVGGIPIPEHNMRGLVKMMKDTVDFVKDGGWLHIYAEGSMWEYYAPIRPFKDGAGYFAYKTDRPIIPMAYSYRPVGWIRKHIFKQIAKFTLNIGEPIFIDKSLSKDEAIKKITIEAHKAVCKLAGYKEGENIYQPLYNKETSKRIDYYTSEYGVGYKGSW